MSPPSTLTLRSASSPYRGPTGRSRLLNAALTVPALGVIVSSLPFSAIYYMLFRPRGFNLKGYLVLRILRLMSMLVPILPPPETPKARWNAPKTLGLAKRSDVKVERVDVLAAPQDWRVAFAAGPAVVQATRMPGYLLTPPGVSSGAPRDGEKIVLYIHGGGYIRGHPLWTAFPHKLARDTGRRVFAAQYRKTLDEKTAFPGPLLDALAAWAHVTKELGFKPSQIVVCGDSCGAHLTLSLMAQLNALSLPLPGGLALISPWADMTFSFPSWKKYDDFILISKLGRAVKSATRHYAPSEISGPFFSPALAPAGHWTFLANTPVFVSYGGREALADEDELLVRRMREDGVAVTTYKAEYDYHDTPVIDCVVRTKSRAFDHVADGVLELLRLESGSDDEVLGDKAQGEAQTEDHEADISLSTGSVASSAVVVEGEDVASSTVVVEQEDANGAEDETKE